MTAAILAASTATGIAMALGGIACVLVVSAVFYLVGRGEDRDRARDAHDRAAAGLPPLSPSALPPLGGESASEPPAPQAGAGSGTGHGPGPGDGVRSRAPASARGRRRR
jgi:hypothetical protein